MTRLGWRQRPTRGVNDGRMTDQRPLVQTTAGKVLGIWRGQSAAFYGIPFAQAPVGELRFAAPVQVLPWAEVLDASVPGPTPQRRPFGMVTTIPEPSFPGDATLNVNVFTPAPGDARAQLPVLVWIHGGGFFAGSPSSPWYDGVSYNRDGIVTVSLSYRLGFDGFGWIADAPTNRGLRDMILGLEWVRDNIAAFGGDPSQVTIAGQSAGGSAVMCLLASPLAQPLFARAISHSGGGLTRTLAEAERIGLEMADRAAVPPTHAGWSTLTEDAILDLQTAYMAPTEEPPASATDWVARTIRVRKVGLPFVPLTGDDVLPLEPADALASGIGADKDLLAGTVAHEFTMATMGFAETWAGTDPVAALTEGGLPGETAIAYVAAHPELTSTATQCGQLGTDFMFRIPTLRWADTHGPRTWTYDFRWASPALGMAFHCLELPFAWDLLGAQGVTAVAGPNPPQELADQMHAAWVRFITTSDPGWSSWNGHNPYVFAEEQTDTYEISRRLSAAL
jgi:para-nitrobenzyl esterase